MSSPAITWTYSPPGCSSTTGQVLPGAMSTTHTRTPDALGKSRRWQPGPTTTGCTSSTRTVSSMAGAAASEGVLTFGSPRSTAIAARVRMAVADHDRARRLWFGIALSEDHPAQDQRAARGHAGRQRFAEEQPAPCHAERRHQISHHGRARCADAADETVEQRISRTGAQNT